MDEWSRGIPYRQEVFHLSTENSTCLSNLTKRRKPSHEDIVFELLDGCGEILETFRQLFQMFYCLLE